MAVYNAGPFLRPAIEGVIAQDFEDWELIAIDDHSTDGSFEQLKSFRDERIRILRNETNKGNVYTRNRGIGEARGELVAMHDHDDISDPRRLGRQVRFLTRHTAYGMVGTGFWRMDASGAAYRRVTVPASDIAICRTMVTSNPISSGSVMIRRRLVQHLGGYREFFPAEDYDLWIRVAQVALIANLPDALYYWRIHDRAASSTRSVQQEQVARSLRDQIQQRWLDEAHYVGGAGLDSGIPERVTRYARARARACVSPVGQSRPRRLMFFAGMSCPALRAGESAGLLLGDGFRLGADAVRRRFHR